MKKYSISMFSLLISIILVMLVPIQSMASTIQTKPEKTNEYIISTDNENMQKVLNDSYEAIEIESPENLYVADLTDAQVKRLENNSRINFIEENVIIEGCSEEEIPFEYNQWYLDAIGIDEDRYTNRNIKIELIDSGVDYSEDIDVYESINLVDDNENILINDSTGHGTMIAGVICAKNDDYGINGINDNVKLSSVKVLDENNQSTLDKIITAIYWGINNNVNIMNMSFGTVVDSQLLHDAIIDAYNSNILIVAAAGNTNHNRVMYPAAYDEVLAVGSSTATGELSSNSSIDSNLDILAPGEKIVSLNFLDGLYAISGTSIAAAQVTGVASLVWSMDNTKSNQFIKDVICSCANVTTYLDDYDVGIIDYQNIVTNYDEFVSSYTNNSTVNFSTINNYDYSDDADVIVEGLWGNSSSENGHYSLSDDSTIYGGFTNGAMQIARYACIKLDTYSSNNPGIDSNHDGRYDYTPGCFHGYGNYVLNLRFLFDASRCIYDYGYNSSQYQALVRDYNSSFPSSIANSQYNSNNLLTGHYDYSRFKSTMAYIPKMINDRYLLISSYDSGANTNKRYFGLMIFGVALHLAGDMYAHRTIVPSSSATASNQNSYSSSSSYYNTRFAKQHFQSISNFSKNSTNLTEIKKSTVNDYNYNNISSSIKCWEAFVYGVENQCVEFRDVDMFLNNNYNQNNNPYEDNASFCKQRYTSALWACRRMSYKFKNNERIYIGTIFPKFITGTDADNVIFDNCVLNNFENYTKAARFATIISTITQNDWYEHSTSSLV